MVSYTGLSCRSFLKTTLVCCGGILEIHASVPNAMHLQVKTAITRACSFRPPSLFVGHQATAHYSASLVSHTFDLGVLGLRGSPDCERFWGGDDAPLCVPNVLCILSHVSALAEAHLAGRCGGSFRRGTAPEVDLEFVHVWRTRDESPGRSSSL